MRELLIFGLLISRIRLLRKWPWSNRREKVFLNSKTQFYNRDKNINYSSQIMPTCRERDYTNTTKIYLYTHKQIRHSSYRLEHIIQICVVDFVDVVVVVVVSISSYFCFVFQFNLVN